MEKEDSDWKPPFFRCYVSFEGMYWMLHNPVVFHKNGMIQLFLECDVVKGIMICLARILTTNGPVNPQVIPRTNGKASNGKKHGNSCLVVGWVGCIGSENSNKTKYSRVTLKKKKRNFWELDQTNGI